MCVCVWLVDLYKCGFYTQKLGFISFLVKIYTLAVNVGTFVDNWSCCVAFLHERPLVHIYIVCMYVCVHVSVLFRCIDGVCHTVGIADFNWPFIQAAAGPLVISSSEETL